MQEIIIGVYHYISPLTCQEDERMKAMLEVSKKHNVKLVFYNNESIDFNRLSIRGFTPKDGEWETVETSIPEVTINLLPGDFGGKTYIETLLSEVTKFTSVGVSNKYEVYKKLVESEKYKKYAIESIEIEDYTNVLESLNKYKKVVVKPIGGRQGLGIYFIYLDGTDILVVEDGKEISMTDRKFKIFIDNLVRKEEHIVQPYIKCITKDGNPYDFRIHVHRDAKGEWTIAYTYPRIGVNKGILTNMSKGGKTIPIDDFLAREFGQEGPKIRQEIEDLSLELCEFIQEFSDKIINEIGVDIAIDEDGSYYTYELNGGPQAPLYEDIRMEYVMTYARYMYEKHIEEKIEKDLKNIGTKFLETEMKILNGNLKDDFYIGVMTSANSSEENLLNKAMSYVAKKENTKIFFFSPSDVDFENKLIKGNYFDKNYLKSKEYLYPDLIVDRLQYRDNKEFKELYEEFKDISFASIDRQIGLEELYRILETKDLGKYLLDYKKLENSHNIISYLEKENKLVLKANLKEAFNKTIHIEKIGDFYKLKSQEKVEKLDREKLLEKLDANLEEKFEYIVQPYKEILYKNEPFNIRVHMAKDRTKNWSLVKSYVRVGVSNFVGEEYIEELEEVLSFLWLEDMGKIKEEIIDICEKSSNILEKEIGLISELAYDLIIIDKKIYINHIDLNRPTPSFFEYDLASNLVPYAINLLEEVKKNKEA